ncbi:MAG TPA: hypothetical protein VLM85_25360 [Polyangiaceae bacterium]|nr:hypothetical protein [Polyangiaceae bacterium]
MSRLTAIVLSILALATTQMQCSSSAGSSFDAAADAAPDVHYVGGEEIFEAPTPYFDAPSSVAVVRGETVYVPIQDHGVKITGITNLPPGVTAGAWTVQGLPLTADANAPIAKAIATITGDSYSQNIMVYVTGRDGSLDPGFGQNGIVGTLGIAYGISIMSDGRLVVVDGSSSYSSGVVVQRLMPTGALDTTFGQNGMVTLGAGYPRSVAVAPDGEIAIGCLPLGGVHVYVLAADGTLERTIDQAGEASSGAWYATMWSGSNVVVMDGFRSDTVDPSNNIVGADLPQIAPYLAAFPTATTRVMMQGVLNSKPTFTALVPSNGVYTVDATYADGGTTTFADAYWQGTACAMTSTGELIAQLSVAGASDIVRIATDGTLDSTWGAQGHVHVTQAPGPLAYLPGSNCVLVTGGDSKGVTAERLLSDGTMDPTFGYLGSVITATVVGGAFSAAADAAETVLYLGGNGWILRYRVHA